MNKIFIDTNLIVYANDPRDPRDPQKQREAMAMRLKLLQLRKPNKQRPRSVILTLSRSVAQEKKIRYNAGMPEQYHIKNNGFSWSHDKKQTGTDCWG